MRDANIKVIYTSKKRRTKQTGEPIAQALNIPLEVMSRRDVAGLVDRLRTRHADDAVLIVSHTYIIPKLVKELGKRKVSHRIFVTKDEATRSLNAKR